MMYRTLNELLQPYAIFYLLTLFGLINLWRRRRETRDRVLLVTVPFGLLFLLSMPVVSYLAFGTLEWRFPPLKALPPDNQALVVLAGGVQPKDPYRSTSLLGETTLYRCLHAADLYRRSGPCTVVVCGGIVDVEKEDQPVSQLMKDFLIEQAVAPADVLIEDHSRSTFENAVECEKLLAPLRVRRITLVTDGNHMLRAARCFRKLGFEVTPAACSYQASCFEWRLGTFLPSPGAARGNQEVFHEWLGLLWYWLHGRI